MEHIGKSLQHRSVRKVGKTSVYLEATLPGTPAHPTCLHESRTYSHILLFYYKCLFDDYHSCDADAVRQKTINKLLATAAVPTCIIRTNSTINIRSTEITRVVMCIKILKPTGHVMHHQFNIQQLYALPTLYLCVLYLSENKQRLVPLTA